MGSSYLLPTPYSLLPKSHNFVLHKYKNSYTSKLHMSCKRGWGDGQMAISPDSARHLRAPPLHSYSLLPRTKVVRYGTDCLKLLRKSRLPSP
ncbi:hypothetical protein [Moorena sp. SIO3H5]|uniref:hypothetical protein n=1 Tax=Moorena sp. SIO3H5 TaxID=2607834 RepID=UPI0013BE1F82|nr:hypothetical protein [Moorena sp. SIO3H5]NEO68932.1 hypothetical protein [Moorena sp. SIO3H5]